MKEEQAACPGNAYTPPEPASTRKEEPVHGPDMPTQEQKSAKQWHKNIATLCTILGAVFLFAGVMDVVDRHWRVAADARPRGVCFPISSWPLAAAVRC